MPKRKVKVPSTRELRLRNVDEETQDKLDEDYKNGVMQEVLRYEQGEEILSLSKGVYHQGRIVAYYRTTVPPWINEDRERQGTTVSQWVPTLIIRFTGWSAKYNEEVAENELIFRTPTTLCHIQGMLFAHEWNTWRREERGLTERQMGISAWYLDQQNYATLDQAWQQHTGSTISFSEYCGNPNNRGIMDTETVPSEQSNSPVKRGRTKKGAARQHRPESNTNDSMSSAASSSTTSHGSTSSSTENFDTVTFRKKLAGEASGKDDASKPKRVRKRAAPVAVGSSHPATLSITNPVDMLLEHMDVSDSTIATSDGTELNTSAES